MTVKRDGQKRRRKKGFKPAPNSVALGVAVLGARASLYSRQDKYVIFGSQRLPVAINSFPKKKMNMLFNYCKHEDYVSRLVESIKVGP